MAIVASSYNAEIVERLVAGAQEALDRSGVGENDRIVVWVPGAWEIPAAVRRLSQAGGWSGFVALGAIIQGETTHHEHLGREVAACLMRFTEETNLPAAFGVLTCDSEEKANARAGGAEGNKGSECVLHLLETIDVLDQIKKVRS